MSDAAYQQIERAILHLVAHATDRPSLEEIAQHANLSPFHFHRLFSRWAGTTPKRFLQYLALEDVRSRLISTDVLGAALDSGLSSAGRLHDLSVTLEAVTPGELRRGGAGLEIRWGLHPSPFGPALIGITRRGVCHLSFEQSDESGPAVLRTRWPNASLVEDPELSAGMLHRVFRRPPEKGEPLSVWIRGTNFQTRVWDALLRIPPGSTVTYKRIAEALGFPNAARAVGGAVGANPIAYLVPCHRVIRESGALGGYRWGEPRKRVLLAWEAACGVVGETGD